MTSAIGSRAVRARGIHLDHASVVGATITTLVIKPVEG